MIFLPNCQPSASYRFVLFLKPVDLVNFVASAVGTVYEMGPGARLVNSAAILLLLFAVVYLAGNQQEVIFSLAVNAGSQCPEGSWGPPCTCMPGFKGEIKVNNQTNVVEVVACPDNAEGAPACHCREGYEGSLAYKTDSQEWEGSCQPGSISATKVCLAVLTYNRAEYIRMQSMSLQSSRGALPWGTQLRLWVFDDRSTEFGEDELRQWYPMAEKIYINERNLADYGAGNTVYGLEETAKNPDCDIVLTADSDLIFHPGWFKSLVKAMPKTDGILSLYNSCSHKLLYCGNGLCQKMDVGNAGCAFTRDVLLDILSNIQRNRAFDWSFSSYFTRTKGKKLYALSPSMAEHMGAHGSNGPDSAAERAIDFPVHELDDNLKAMVQDNLNSRPQCDLSSLAAKAQPVIL